MSFYEDRILPKIIDVACGTSGMNEWRRAAIDGLEGEVVEIGFGSGHNLPLLPDAITRLYAVDPALKGRELAAERLAACDMPVEFIGLDGQSIPLDDDSVDHALSTFTLCTVPDPSAALRELRRVMKPGGRLHLVEHGKAPTESVFTWQKRIDPVQKRLFGGCHVSRDMVGLTEAAGYDVEVRRADYAEGPKPWSYFTVAVATSPVD